MQKLDKKEDANTRRKESFKLLLIDSKSFDTEANTNTNPLKETRFKKTKGRVYIWFSDIHLIRFAVTKTRFLASISLRTLLLLCYMTVSRMTLTWPFSGGWVLQKVDINLLVLLEAFWVWPPLGLFQILTILVQYLNIDALKTYFSSFWPQV